MSLWRLLAGSISRNVIKFNRQPTTTQAAVLSSILTFCPAIACGLYARLYDHDRNCPITADENIMMMNTGTVNINTRSENQELFKKIEKRLNFKPLAINMRENRAETSAQENGALLIISEDKQNQISSLKIETNINNNTNTAKSPTNKDQNNEKERFYFQGLQYECDVSSIFDECCQEKCREKKPDNRHLSLYGNTKPRTRPDDAYAANLDSGCLAPSVVEPSPSQQDASLQLKQIFHPYLGMAVKVKPGHGKATLGSPISLRLHHGNSLCVLQPPPCVVNHAMPMKTPNPSTEEHSFDIGVGVSVEEKSEPEAKINMPQSFQPPIVPSTTISPPPTPAQLQLMSIRDTKTATAATTTSSPSTSATATTKDTGGDLEHPLLQQATSPCAHFTGSRSNEEHEDSTATVPPTPPNADSRHTTPKLLSQPDHLPTQAHSLLILPELLSS